MALLTLPDGTVVDLGHHEAVDVSDGWHTFRELYEHRNTLVLAVLRSVPGTAWWSRRHEGDDEDMSGFVITGATLPTGVITYHMPDRFVPLLEAAGVRHVPVAPAWDGHSPTDTLDRIRQWVTHA